MRIIKVATDNPNTYYDIVSRLKKTHLKFSSVPPGQNASSSQDLILTSQNESSAYGRKAVAIEDLDEDPLIMEGQLLSRLLDESRRNLLIGIDPGSRIGVVMFYGGRELGSLTSSLADEVVDLLVRVVRKVSHSSYSVKIGSGDPKSSLRLAKLMRERLAAFCLHRDCR